MKKLSIALLVGLLALVAGAAESLRLATTTSTENSGLFDVLLPPFEQAHDADVQVISVGTGKALALGRSGDVDVVLVHARGLEDEFVAQGYGVDRRDVMYNDFVIIGPESDPAGIAGMSDVAGALEAIARAEQTFVSRGDESGTHVRELQLWSAADIQPSGGWYREAGSGMGAVITMAAEMRGYTLSDRGTYLAYRNKAGLHVLVEGDARLRNPYGVIMVNPAHHPHVKADLARGFLNYLVSDAARGIINGYKKHGEQLFYVRGD